jgi:hypothetical protein
MSSRKGESDGLPTRNVEAVRRRFGIATWISVALTTDGGERIWI